MCACGCVLRHSVVSMPSFVFCVCLCACVCLAQEDAATFKRILRMLPADVALVCTLAVHAEMTT